MLVFDCGGRWGEGSGGEEMCRNVRERHKQLRNCPGPDIVTTVMTIIIIIIL